MVSTKVWDSEGLMKTRSVTHYIIVTVRVENTASPPLVLDWPKVPSHYNTRLLGFYRTSK